MGLGSTVGKRIAPRLQELAPEKTSTALRAALDKAISGAGPLPPAWASGEKQLRNENGDVDRAIHEVIEIHVRLSGAQGFLTNLGGLVTAAVAMPANVSGLALLQCRMIAAIAHLRGYDLDDPRVRNAILVTMLGEEEVDRLVRKKKLPGPPMSLATAPVADPDLDRIVSAHVASELIAKVAGKRLATTVGRRIPVLGGLVGLSADAYSTWRVGRYADRELRPRHRA